MFCIHLLFHTFILCCHISASVSGCPPSRAASASARSRPLRGLVLGSGRALLGAAAASAHRCGSCAQTFFSFFFDHNGYWDSNPSCTTVASIYDSPALQPSPRVSPGSVASVGILLVFSRAQPAQFAQHWLYAHWVLLPPPSSALFARSYGPFPQPSASAEAHAPTASAAAGFCLRQCFGCTRASRRGEAGEHQRTCESSYEHAGSRRSEERCLVQFRELARSLFWRRW